VSLDVLTRSREATGNNAGAEFGARRLVGRGDDLSAQQVR
jgi:hypothetical protein